MNSSEFKNEHPELSHFEGNDLWDIMEHSLLKQKQGIEIIQQTKPFFKRYKLRYLFYRVSYPTFYRKGYKWHERCSNCKYASNQSFCIFISQEGMKKYCCKCKKELVLENNNSLLRKVYLISKLLTTFFWKALDLMHVVRSSEQGRYDIFGDESRFAFYTYDMETGKSKTILKKRRWWQYIFIPR